MTCEFCGTTNPEAHRNTVCPNTQKPAMSALSERMETLKAIGALQGECAVKARLYRETAPELAERYSRASFAGIGARLAMQAAIMAEHEAGKL